ncbi:hypothetical protein ACFYVR_18590 [Rhodococcus sp. NPDC003318]|uniref:hypothetical protein n=1 Tax=Rhodococcus sp. NPDC003318 TaxID=3364503 RepID=UPI00367A474B
MTDKTPTASHRDLVARVHEAEGFAVTLPIVGRVGIPRPEHLAFYIALGGLAALEIIEWPVAAIVVGGHILTTEQHHRTLHDIGEALETA